MKLGFPAGRRALDPADPGATGRVRGQPIRAESLLTGERLVPGHSGKSNWLAHLARYHFAAQWAPGGRVLDLACGVGYGSQLLAQAGARWVVGADLSPETILYAVQRYPHPRVRFLVADACRSVFPARTFDLIVSLESLEHVPEPEAFVRHAGQWLTPGGRWIVSTPNRLEWSDRGVRSAFHLQEWTGPEFEALLRRGFRTVELYAQRNLEDHPTVAQPLFGTPPEGSLQARLRRRLPASWRHVIGRTLTLGLDAWRNRRFHYRDCWPQPLAEDAAPDQAHYFVAVCLEPF